MTVVDVGHEPVVGGIGFTGNSAARLDCGTVSVALRRARSMGEINLVNRCLPDRTHVSRGAAITWGGARAIGLLLAETLIGSTHDRIYRNL